MCLYPKLITNPKYRVNKKNGGIIPPVTDERTLKVPIGCGKCMECRKQKANGWKTRLMEEIRSDKEGTFVTLTYTDEAIVELREEVIKEMGEIDGYELENEIARRSVELFRKRWHKETGSSVKHWLITELGGNNSERIHIHGIIWTKDKYKIQRIWKYGRNNYYGTYMNERTGNYITKYMNKTDLKHPNYTPKILTSPGIGKAYTDSNRTEQVKYRENGETVRYYRHRNGYKGAMPIYYRNKIYTEEQREKLWIEKLDKGIRWVCGEKINTKHGYDIYYKALEYHRPRTIALGYPEPKFIWTQAKYEHERRVLNQLQRYGKAFHSDECRQTEK